MIKLKSKKLFKRSSKQNAGSNGACGEYGTGTGTQTGEIEWEVRPGGMLVQKRENSKGAGEVITVRVSTGSAWHDISIGATSTFGNFITVIVYYILVFKKCHFLQVQGPVCSIR